MLGGLISLLLVCATPVSLALSNATTVNASTGGPSLSLVTAATNANATSGPVPILTNSVNATMSANSDDQSRVMKGPSNRTARVKDASVSPRARTGKAEERQDDITKKKEGKAKTEEEEIVDLKTKLKETKVSVDHQQHMIKNAKEELQAAKDKEDFFGGRMELMVLLGVVLAASISLGLFVASERQKRALHKELEAMGMRIEQEKERRDEKEMAAAAARQQIIEAAAVNAAATA